MKSNELRIGNYIINEVDAVSEMSGYYIYELSRVENSKRVKSITSKFKQIPLTQEWLINLGFDKIKIGEGYLSYFIYRKGNIKHYTHTNNWTVFDKYIHDLENVHQLQNLYFSLTGEELILIK